MRKYIIFLVVLISTFGCEKEVSVSPPDGEATKAFVYVTSKPSGAMIFKNGKYSGKRTPDTLKFLDFGEYEIKLQMEYFRDTVFSVEVNEEKLESIDIDYSTNPLMLGSAYCISTPPGATIYMNDSLITGKTNDTIKNLVPGIYKFRYSYPEHRDGEIEVIVRSNRVIRAPVMLQDTSIWVDYNHANSEIKYDYLNCIVVDKNNIKWIGTEGVGLIKFDEKNFTVYSPPIFPIPSGLVTSLDIDDNDVKWMGTYGGIASFDGNSWQAFREWNSELPSDYVEDIKCEKGTSNIWVGTRGGAAKFNGFNEWNVFRWDTINVTYPYGTIMTVNIDRNHTKWFGTAYAGIYSLVDTTWSNISVGYPPELPELPNDFVVCSGQSPVNDELWFGHRHYGEASGGLSMFNGSNWKKFTSLFTFQFLRFIYIDDRDVKWIGTDNGLYRFKQTNLITVFKSNNSGIMVNDIKDVVRDKNGIIWIATAGGGLIKYKGEMNK